MPQAVSLQPPEGNVLTSQKKTQSGTHKEENPSVYRSKKVAAEKR